MHSMQKVQVRGDRAKLNMLMYFRQQKVQVRYVSGMLIKLK
jgi:hypothetical protein